MARVINGKYFYGNEISSYGLQNGYVDYGTLAKAFDCVLNNTIMEETWKYSEWEQVSGIIDNSEQIEKLEEQIEELEEQIDTENNAETTNELKKQIEELKDKKSELEEEQDYPPEVYQWYIVSDRGADILTECDEIVYRNEELDLNLWGVTHYGTSWDYVLTNIKIDW